MYDRPGWKRKLTRGDVLGEGATAQQLQQQTAHRAVLPDVIAVAPTCTTHTRVQQQLSIAPLDPLALEYAYEGIL